MKRPVWVIGGVLVLVGLVGWMVLRPTSEHVVVSFIDQFDQAVEVRPTPETFSVGETTLAGETRRSIAATGPSRIAWTVTVPERSWLVVSAGLLEEAWTVKGDGVVFRISLNDDEILNMVIDPYSETSHRRWNEFEVDLSEFAGETMSLYLKTFSSPPGPSNSEGDMPVWGEPRIITR